MSEQIITLILILLVIISATLHIRADYAKNYKQIYFFKPLTLILIILICFLQTNILPSSYKKFILAGLLFSMFGDIFLMLKEAQFTKGLLAFLIAHILYIFAIVYNFSYQSNYIILFFIVLLFLLFAKQIISNSGSKKIYITIYSVVIMFLLWQALSRLIFEMNNSAVLFGVGVLFFTISDSLLAYNKFVRKISNAQVLILTTYYLAQLLIALSV